MILRVCICIRELCDQLANVDLQAVSRESAFEALP